MPTMHLDEETIQRLLNGELERFAESPAHLHLTQCEECRARLEAAAREEEETHALLRFADHSPPAVSVEAIANRARQLQEEERARNLRRTAGMRRAAGILLVIGLAGAAYAFPGSPLPKWLSAAMGWIRESGSGPPVSAPQVTSREDGGSMSGIAVPAGKNLVIVFTSPQEEGAVKVSITEENDVVVRGPSGSANFTSEEEQLVIHNESSAESFEIEIPKNAPRIEIRVGEKTIFLKEGNRLSPEATSILPLQGSQ
jgi:anti-sigma factor RsiW